MTSSPPELVLLHRDQQILPVIYCNVIMHSQNMAWERIENCVCTEQIINQSLLLHSRISGRKFVNLLLGR